jgi:hypothetical protein
MLERAVTCLRPPEPKGAAVEWDFPGILFTVFILAPAVPILESAALSALLSAPAGIWDTLFTS